MTGSKHLVSCLGEPMRSLPQPFTLIRIIQMVSEGKDISPLLSECPKLMNNPGARERFVRQIEIYSEQTLKKLPAQREKRLNEEFHVINDAEVDELIERTGESDLGLALVHSIQQCKINAVGLCGVVAMQYVSTDCSHNLLKAAIRACQRYESAVQVLDSCCEILIEQQRCHD